MLAAANIQLDGFTTLEQGMDSGKSPSLIGQNTVAFANNVTFRGGFPTTRPGWTSCRIDWDLIDSEDVFVAGKFQGAGSYRPDQGDDELFASVDGRMFRFVWGVGGWNGSDVTPASDPNPKFMERAYFCQAESFLIVQDDFSTALIWTGSSFRRATYDEVPIGANMTYGIGRLWVSRRNEYVAGDIVGGPTGTEAFNYRDSVLKFTENTYLSEGGAFSVNGNITALTFVADLETATGDGFLVISTQDRVYSNRVPADRAAWKNLSEPIQKVIQLNYGAAGDRCVTPVNGDLFYRSTDGIRSLITAVRRFQEPGNTPISNEVLRPVDADCVPYIHAASSVLFDNRLLMTVSPYKTSRGILFRGLVSLDYDIVSGIRNKLPPAWEGVWSGPKVFQVLKARIRGEDRMFAFVLNSDGTIGISELDLQATDDDGNPITWWVESSAFGFRSRMEIKKLAGADLWLDRINGSVTMSLKYRPDQYPGWIDWHTWGECTTVKDCSLSGGCLPLLTRNEGYYSRRKVPMPSDACLSFAGRPATNAYEFQFRIGGTGHLRLRTFRVQAAVKVDDAIGDCSGSETCRLLEVCAGQDV